MEDNKKKEELLKKFLDKQESKCEGEECLIPEKSDIVEKMNKKLVMQDGRQLLREVINESN